MKNISILGSTGSIGKSSLSVVSSHPGLFNVLGLSTNKDIEEIERQVKEFTPRLVVICDRSSYEVFITKDISSGLEVLYGEEALLELARDSDLDLLINALIGFVGFLPTVEGIKCGKDIALANKETIVSGGELILEMADFYGSNIIPVDSEHSALLFLLRFSKRSEVRRLIVTASGGPFRDLPVDEFGDITVARALCHPTWEMGRKITIDSSTLLNKGLEVLEAHYLFNFPLEGIDVIIHKESIVHSMIETIDGEVYAQLGIRDMRLPIQNAMTYPDIIGNDYGRLKLWELGTLSFSSPDFDKFPLLRLAYDVGDKGGTLPTVLNASNEVAVYAFLDGLIAYIDIFNLVKRSVEAHSNVLSPSLDDILSADSWARSYAKGLIDGIGT